MTPPAIRAEAAQVARIDRAVRPQIGDLMLPVNQKKPYPLWWRAIIAAALGAALALAAVFAGNAVIAADIAAEQVGERT